jgi:hypothetical protein
MPFFFSIFLLEGGNSLSYCGEPKTWIEAKTFCEVKGGRLMNRGTENDAVFLQRTDIPAYQEIWLGQYKGLSGWVEKIGKNFILLIVYLIEKLKKKNLKNIFFNIFMQEKEQG